VRLRFAILLVALSTAEAALVSHASPRVPIPRGAHLVGAAALGSGFTAVVYEQHPRTASPWAARTLELRRGGELLRRFRAQNEALPFLATDITEDGVRDVLAFNSRGGSGGWGTYRLYAGPGLREVWIHNTSIDIGLATLSRGALISWSAVPSSKTSKDQVHCCWTRWRRDERRWRGGRLTLARRETGPPPKVRRPLPLRDR
jgi:hypothetical protein